MALDESAVSDLLEALRTGEGTDLVRELAVSASGPSLSSAAQITPSASRTRSPGRRPPAPHAHAVRRGMSLAWASVQSLRKDGAFTRSQG
jgi:hypothetical protein